MKLPKKIKIDLYEIIKRQDKVDEFWDMISDYLSDTYGYCLYGYSLPQEINIEIDNIEWDTSEN